MSLELVGLSIVGIIGIAIIALVWNAFWLWWQSVLSDAPVGLLQNHFHALQESEARAHRESADHC